MEKSDYLKPADTVSITVLGPDDSQLYKSTGSGFHSIEAAIRETLANASLDVNPEDCVFEVNNETTDVFHRYRINAHGNLKLIV